MGSRSIGWVPAVDGFGVGAMAHVGQPLPHDGAQHLRVRPRRPHLRAGGDRLRRRPTGPESGRDGRAWARTAPPAGMPWTRRRPSTSGGTSPTGHRTRTPATPRSPASSRRTAATATAPGSGSSTAATATPSTWTRCTAETVDVDAHLQLRGLPDPVADRARHQGPGEADHRRRQADRAHRAAAPRRGRQRRSPARSSSSSARSARRSGPPPATRSARPATTPSRPGRSSPRPGG